LFSAAFSWFATCPAMNARLRHAPACRQTLDKPEQRQPLVSGGGPTTAARIAPVAVQQGLVTGFRPALSDGLFHRPLSVVVVAHDHRRRGIGRPRAGDALDNNDRMPGSCRRGRTGVSAFDEKPGLAASEVALLRRGTRRQRWRGVQPLTPAA
jgi:hypothetical protein